MVSGYGPYGGIGVPAAAVYASGYGTAIRSMHFVLFWKVKDVVCSCIGSAAADDDDASGSGNGRSSGRAPYGAIGSGYQDPYYGSAGAADIAEEYGPLPTTSSYARASSEYGTCI